MKAARRSVVVQCDRCACSGTGTIGASARLVSVNLAANHAGPEILHASCGGRFVAFDIGGDR